MRDTHADVKFEGSARLLLAGLLIIQVFLGYEWFMSGLSKVLAGNFVTGIGETLATQSRDLSGWYKSFLDGAVIPNSQLFGYLVMIGELTVGVALIVLAATWWFRWSMLSITARSVLLWMITLAGLAAVFMNINFHLASGSTHPWFIAADPFGEGIDLDSVMPVIQLTISAVAFAFLRRIRATHPTSQTGQPVTAPS